MVVYHYSINKNEIKDDILNDNNHIGKYNTINNDIYKYNEDIVNQGKGSTEIIFKTNNLNNKNKYNTINITRSHYLIERENDNNNIYPNEGVEQVIEQSDYNYYSNKKEVLRNMRYKLIAKKENKRYYEENDDSDDNNDNDDNEYIFPVKRSKTINNYNYLLKSKSADKVSVKNIRKNMSKSNSDKAFELLRDYSFDQNQF